MKIQCDVCEKKEAAVFCAADEAALCEGCDERVHHANKLASRHLRFTLVHPSCNHAPPLCDVCQERRAFLFCREDRAILCTECDIPIHKANEHTQSHSRFLLTGVKLSSSSSSSSSSSPHPHSCPPMSTCSDPNPNRVTAVNVPSYDHDLVSQYSYTSNDDVTNPFTTTTTTTNCSHISEERSISTSHMLSEYLMETVPEWRLEDLLDPSFASHHNLSKTHGCTNTRAVNEKQQGEEVMDPIGPEDSDCPDPAVHSSALPNPIFLLFSSGQSLS